MSSYQQYPYSLSALGISPYPTSNSGGKRFAQTMGEQHAATYQHDNHVSPRRMGYSFYNAEDDDEDGEVFGALKHKLENLRSGIDQDYCSSEQQRASSSQQPLPRAQLHLMEPSGGLDSPPSLFGNDRVKEEWTVRNRKGPPIFIHQSPSLMSSQHYQSTPNGGNYQHQHASPLMVDLHADNNGGIVYPSRFRLHIFVPELLEHATTFTDIVFGMVFPLELKDLALDDVRERVALEVRQQLRHRRSSADGVENGTEGRKTLPSSSSSRRTTTHVSIQKTPLQIVEEKLASNLWNLPQEYRLFFRPHQHAHPIEEVVVLEQEIAGRCHQKQNAVPNEGGKTDGREEVKFNNSGLPPLASILSVIQKGSSGMSSCTNVDVDVFLFHSAHCKA